MRVLQLGPYPPPYGGVQVNIVAIRRYLLRHGHECAVANITRHRKAEADGVYHPETAPELVKLILGLRPDVIHLHVGGTVPLRLLGLALVCTLLPGRKSVLTLHSGGYPNSPAGRGASTRTLRGIVFRRFDGVIAVNRQIAEMFARFGVAPSRVRVIGPHALPPLPEGVTLPPRLRSFIDAHDPVLLTVGLLERHYDLALQIDALGKVRERRARAGLVIVGSGSLEGELRERIAGTPYADDVLLCGDVAHEVTLHAISSCDLFLRTTLYDGDSISVREAQHLGIPVVATDNGMRPAGVHLVPVSNLPALAEAILLALPPNGGAPRRARGATTTCREDDENIAAVCELYRELLGAGGPPGGGARKL